MASLRENGWSDHYGAMHIAAAYAGFKLDQPYFIRGVWHHGCSGPWEDYTPDILACNTPRAKGLPVLTARQDQADILKAGGYAQARAIGLPILYTSPSGLPRLPRSLLVMPCHSLTGFTFPERAPFRAYVEEIRAIAGDFDRVVVCIHPSCRINGLWVDEFTAAGIELVDGAQVNDLNSLPRMRALFEQFETITTNGWGSHIAYALALGARVAIYGTYPAPGEENLLKDATWAADRAALKVALSATTLEREHAFLKDFKVPPASALANPPLGNWLVGTQHKLEPAAMADLLRKLIEPQADVVGRYQAQRAKLRPQAAALAAKGRKTEAVKLLLGLVQAAVDTKNALCIHEALREVCVDLGPLDPVRADYLRAQAQKLEAHLGATVAAA
jgi:hypothetical protein